MLKKTTRRIMGAITPTEIATQQQNHPYVKNIQHIKLLSVFEVFHKTSQIQSRRSGVDVDFSWNLWMNKGWCYVVPIGELHSFDMPDYVEEYGYWNNVDKPDNLTDKQWSRREEVWNTLTGDTNASYNQYRLCHSIIDNIRQDFTFEQEMEKRILHNNNS